MMLSKGEFFAKLGELLNENDVRFAFANEELEVAEVQIGAEMEEAWIILIPKGETHEETGPWYIGRHRKPGQPPLFLGLAAREQDATDSEEYPGSLDTRSIRGKP